MVSNDSKWKKLSKPFMFAKKAYFQFSNRYFLLRFIFVYKKFLKLTFKIGFGIQNHLLNLVLVLSIHKGYFVGKRLVLNICNKYFWYTKMFRCISFILFFNCWQKYKGCTFTNSCLGESCYWWFIVMCVTRALQKSFIT